MVEKDKLSPEQDKVHVSHEKINLDQENNHINPEHEKEISAKNAEAARASIEDLAKNTNELPTVQDLSGNKTDENISWTSRELLSQSYQRMLSSIRNRLSKPEKNFSKSIHNPLIEKTSEIVGSSVARPSGILMGSILSFIGSLVGYIVARRLGGELPYSIFGILFVGGFALGLLVEILFIIYKKRKLK